MNLSLKRNRALFLSAAVAATMATSLGASSPLYAQSATGNTPPNAPESLTIDGQPCGPDTTVKVGAAVSWTVTATLSDDDGDNMDGILTWTDTYSGTEQSWNTAGVDGLRATWSVRSSSVPGDSYQVTAAASDRDSTGPASGGCTVLIDRTPPEQPTVTSTDYPDEGGPYGSPGEPGQFTLRSGSGDTAGYYWSFQDAVGDNDVPISTLGSAATVTLAPPNSGPITLSVWAYDDHGNISGKTTYRIFVGF
ncbi:hypothetical protein [Salininema proteolyticum]|uniref:PKD domain-containing protein n=1 Tax=Salininema proteolyticum TaxID=1607685 RepID=A0ABV8TV68_9ACTN